MNYLYACLVILLAGACHQPQVDQDAQRIQTNTNHLIAFGSQNPPAPNGVRLAEVHLDGRRFLKYIYSDGFLADEICYSTDPRAIYLSTSHYYRDQLGLIKIETKGRTYDEGVIGNDTTLLLYAQTFVRPSDLSLQTTGANLTFTKNGTLLGQTDQSVSISYKADSKNNISSATNTRWDDYPNSTTTVTYQYDTLSNPFRTTGRVVLQSRFSAFETDYSPNNVTKATFSNPTLNYTGTIDYEYEYRSDGYPTKLILRDSREQVYRPVFEFIYTN